MVEDGTGGTKSRRERNARVMGTTVKTPRRNSPVFATGDLQLRVGVDEQQVDVRARSQVCCGDGALAGMYWLFKILYIVGSP